MSPIFEPLLIRFIEVTLKAYTALALLALSVTPAAPASEPGAGATTGAAASPGADRDSNAK